VSLNDRGLHNLSLPNISHLIVQKYIKFDIFVNQSSHRPGLQRLIRQAHPP
jgi:hypothetical protein